MYVQRERETYFLPERQTGRCSLPPDKFHHAAGPLEYEKQPKC